MYNLSQIIKRLEKIANLNTEDAKELKYLINNEVYYLKHIKDQFEKIL